MRFGLGVDNPSNLVCCYQPGVLRRRLRMPQVGKPLLYTISSATNGTKLNGRNHRFTVPGCTC